VNIDLKSNIILHGGQHSMQQLFVLQNLKQIMRAPY